MMLLIFITFLPSLFILNFQGVIDDSKYTNFYDSIAQEMFLKNNTIENGRLSTEEDIDFTFDIFRFTNRDDFSYLIQIKFLETGMSMQLSDQEIAFTSYDSNVFIDFNDLSIQSVSAFTRYVENFIESVSIVSVIYGLSIFISALFDYLFITLFLTLLMSFSIFKSTLHFKKRFKIGIYLSSSYVIFNMLTILFQIEALQFFSLLVTYFYYVSFYKQFKGGQTIGKI